MAINVRKISGVVSVQQDSNTPKYYFGLTGKYTALPNNDIQIQIGGDSFVIPMTNLKVNGQTPSTITTAFTLLNAIFGS